MSDFSMMLLRLICGPKAPLIYQNYRRSVHDVKNKLMVNEAENRKARTETERLIRVGDELIQSLKKH